MAPKHGEGEIKRDEQGVWRVYYQSASDYVGADSINFVAVAVDGAGKESAPTTISINVTRPRKTPSIGGAIQSGNAPSAGNS